MARVNIESQWWSDPRRTKLLLKIGFYADSAAVNMWRTAQEYWGRNYGLIPKEIFDSLEYASDLLEVGLAEVQDSGVYVRGSNQHLSWLHEQRERARAAGKKGGLKSAESRRNKYGSAIPFGASNRSETEANSEANPSEPKPSDSVSVSKKEYNNAQNASGDAHNTILTPVPKKAKYREQIENLYREHYPRKIGKQKGIEKLARSIQSAEDLQAFEIAIKKFALHHKNTDPQFIPYFSSFATSWRDVLDEDWGSAQKPQTPMSERMLLE